MGDGTHVTCDANHRGFLVFIVTTPAVSPNWGDARRWELKDYGSAEMTSTPGAKGDRAELSADWMRLDWWGNRSCGADEVMNVPVTIYECVWE